MGNKASKGIPKEPSPYMQKQIDNKAGHERVKNELVAFEQNFPPAAVYELATFEVKPESFKEFTTTLVQFYQTREGCRIVTVLTEVGSCTLRALVMYNSYYDYDQAKLHQEQSPQYDTLRSTIRNAESDIVAQSTGKYKDHIVGTEYRGSPFAQTTFVANPDTDGYSYFYVENPQKLGRAFAFFGQQSPCFSSLEFCGVFTFLTTNPGDNFELWRTQQPNDAHLALLLTAGLTPSGKNMTDNVFQNARNGLNVAQGAEAQAALGSFDKKVKLCRAVPGLSTQWPPASAGGGARPVTL